MRVCFQGFGQMLQIGLVALDLRKFHKGGAVFHPHVPLRRKNAGAMGQSSFGGTEDASL